MDSVLLLKAVEIFNGLYEKYKNLKLPVKSVLIDSLGELGLDMFLHFSAGLVVCDLSFHNPNVFYELSLRHSTKRPTIHIIRKRDGIPFDVNDFRTIIK